MSAPVDPKGLDEALHAAYLTATQPVGEVEAGIVGRLHKRADQLGMLLSDPPKPHPDAVLMREAAVALTAAIRKGTP